MKRAVVFISALAALGAAPALADNGQVFDAAAQLRAYSTGESPTVAQCFNGAAISGVSRAGQNRILIQPSKRGVYEVRLLDDCDALNSAEKIALRSGGGDTVCPHSRAEMVVQSASGPRRCRISDIRRLTAPEVAALAGGARR